MSMKAKAFILGMMILLASPYLKKSLLKRGGTQKPMPVPVAPSTQPSRVAVRYTSRGRQLTGEERRRCSAQIAALEELEVGFSIAVTTRGISLAVVNGTDLVSNVLLKSGSWEGKEILNTFGAYGELLQGRQAGTCSVTPCDRVFLDVGANLGTWTFHASQQGYHTISIEGMPSNFALLQLSKCLNPELAPRVNLVNSFVSEGSEYCIVVCDYANRGDVALTCQDHEWTDAEMQVYLDNMHEAGRHQIHLTRTMTRKLDDVVAEALAAHPTFSNVFDGVKIDIEGSELMAAKGAQRLLSNGLPVIFSEVWHQIRGGPHPDAYFKLMREAGYEVRDTLCKTAWGPEGDAAVVQRMATSLIENVCFVKSS